MDSDPRSKGEGGVGAPPGAAGSLQPFEADSESLVEFDQTEAADHLERLAADADLILELRRAGYEGPRWELLADALARYGYQVIRAWIRQGSIFARCRERKLRKQAAPPMPSYVFQPHEVEDLTVDTVAESVTKFQSRVLKAGIYDPARGASVKTFFIGQCLIRFPEVYEPWLRRWRRERRQANVADLTEVLPAHHLGDDPEAATVTRLEIRRGLDGVDERTRLVLRLTAAGYSQEEIAARLGPDATTRTVEGLLYRYRQRLQKGA